MKFHLSGRQQKELLERATELRIAIPHPPDEVDALEYARQYLEVPRGAIRAAEAIELTTRPKLGSVITTDDLTTCLGAILHDDQPGQPGLFTAQVVAIVCTLAATEQPRHRSRTQWAARFGGDA